MPQTSRRTFYSAIASLICLFAASATPIPLYSRYQASIGLTRSEISLTAVFYFLGCILSLLVLAKLSNLLGRKKTSLLALVFGLLGLVLLLVLQQAGLLMLARFLQGLACGLGSAVLSIYILESGQTVNPSLAKAMTGSAVVIGLAVGSLLSGGLVQLFPSLLSLAYWVILVATVLCIWGIAGAQDTSKTESFSWKKLVPEIALPKASRVFFPAAACIFIGTWAIGGYFQAFSSTIASSIFHQNSPLLAGIILSVFMAPNFIGARWSGQFQSRQAKKYGLLAFAAFMTLMNLAFQLQSLLLFLLTAIGAGISQGICYSAGIQDLLSGGTESERTGLMAVVYLVSYGGAAVPNFLIGALATGLSFTGISLIYLVIVLVITGAMFAVLPKK